MEGVINEFGSSLSQTEIRQIISNFESEKYRIMESPRILEIDISGVYVNEDGPHQNVIEALTATTWKKISNPKLKAHTYSESSLYVNFIGTKYFESREQMDFLYSKAWDLKWFTDSPPTAPIKPVTIIDNISFKEALKVKNHLSVEISCNMDYYLANREEMEKDLGRKLENLDLNNNDLIEKLERELFFIESVKIFGEENDQEEKALSTVIFRDFRVLFSDGNTTCATAKRGERYLIFYYDS